MAFHNLLSKCDRALVAYLINEGAGSDSDIFHHKRASNIPSPLPYTTVFSESAEEVTDYSATYKVKASVDVHTNAAPDKDEDTDQMKLDSDERTAATFDALHDQYLQSGDKLADAITAAAAGAGVADFSIQDVKVTSIEQGRGEKEGEWIDTINLELVCRPSGGD
jgi:hypothetical protein